MLAWIVIGIAAVVAVCVTTAALFTGGHLRQPRVTGPDWTLPPPVELRAVRFPLTWRGYDPAHVDVYLDAVATAYEALYIAARPAAISQAQERLAARPGGSADDRRRDDGGGHGTDGGLS